MNSFKKTGFLLVVCGMFYSGNALDAKSAEISNKFYSKTSAYLAYDRANFIGALDRLLETPRQYNWAGSGGKVRNSTTKHSLLIGFGYSVYFRLNNLVNPFVGVDANVNVSKTTTFLNANGANIVAKENGRVGFKLGAKINIVKENIFAIEPYAMAGMNIAKLGIKGVDMHNNIEISHTLGKIFGCGANFIINNIFIIGAEYVYTVNNFNKMRDQRYAIGSYVYGPYKIHTHNFVAKFGAQFL